MINLNRFYKFQTKNLPLKRRVSKLPFRIGSILIFLHLLLGIGNIQAQDVAYIRYNMVEPWTRNGNINAMNDVFGAGNWTDAGLTTAVFVAPYKFVLIEGGENSTTEMRDFLNINATLIENWVAAGNILCISAASNEITGSFSLPFGITSTRDIAAEAQPANNCHPIFAGPLTPALAAVYTGNSFHHNYITGTGLVGILEDTRAGNNIVLGEKNWGLGKVIVGGLTLPFFEDASWIPAPNVTNLHRNILSYGYNNLPPSLVQPEINILGAGNSIVDGDITPDVADDTDFGNVGASSIKTYTITNTGTDALAVTSITSDNTDFVVSNVPTTVAIGSTATFDVTFSTIVFTQQTAVITINNNDCDEGVYDFVVQGQKIPSTPPLPTPPRATNFTATAVSTIQINLEWEPVTSNITSYNLYQDGILIDNLPISTRSYEVTGLTPDTFYAFSLVSVNQRPGEIKLSSPVADNARTFPEAPVLLSQTNVCGSGNSTVRVSSTGAIYRVYADATSTFILVETIGGILTFPTVSETTTFYVSVVSNEQESGRTAVTITVEPTFEAMVLGENNQISCESTLLLIAQNVEDATYTWLRNGIEIGTGENFEANLSGTYQVYISKGACNILSETVIVRLNFTPIANIAQLNGTRFCDGGMLSAIETNSNATYEWLLNNLVVGQGTNLSVSESGVYTLQVTENGCQSSTAIEVVVAPTPELPTLTASETTICPNTETTISVQNIENGVTYQWFRNGRDLRETGSSFSTSLQGKYQVLAVSTINSTCSVLSDELVINRSEIIPVYLRVSEDRKSLFVEDANGSQDDILSVEWYFEGEATASLGTDNQITPTENGSYSALVTNQNGCIIQTRTVSFIVPVVPVITGEEDLTLDLFNIYPNPSTGIFNIQFPIALIEDIQVTIFDGIGRAVYTQTLEKGNQDFSVNMNGVSKGMYMIHFNQNGSTYSKQIIIE